MIIDFSIDEKTMQNVTLIPQTHKTKSKDYFLFKHLFEPVFYQPCHSSVALVVRV